MPVGDNGGGAVLVASSESVILPQSDIPLRHTSVLRDRSPEPSAAYAATQTFQL
jgi:hypothetical protein